MTEQKQDYEGIKFFGEIDRSSNGRISSTYPAWYSEIKVDNLRESVRKLEKQVNEGTVHGTKLPALKQRLKKEKARLDAIESSRPKIDGVMKDKVYKDYHNIQKLVAESLFTRDEMMMGLADPHTEARRMSEYLIEGINPVLAEACNVRMMNGKVTRNGAWKIGKILGKALGEESTNMELLRKNKMTVRTSGGRK